ncbi:hypothetical protein M2651_05785 [Clostridium sp. SYSU_GA19001]|uniref:phage head-tail connector protein n=1 Tax=Clostridium caldaquaticum TaxID=2940653 RepID=UPI002076DB64|nr:phage head-tail connector protein [Clostridium caldaquaticum]MCM8710536.1 hypothetical protein [Clostridium caldaquaticum]
MITTLENAKKLLGINDNSKDYELEEKLKSLEITIRNLTNNKFLDTRIRVKGNFLFQDKKIMGINFQDYGFRKDNTIEIVDSKLNDGIYVITAIDNSSIIVDKILEYETGIKTMITKVVYPYDIVQGVIKLIQYDFKMSNKIGIKQETISRYSVTYYDLNSTESIEGYPVTLMKFLNKYKKLRWS